MSSAFSWLSSIARCLSNVIAAWHYAQASKLDARRARLTSYEQQNAAQPSVPNVKLRLPQSGVVATVQVIPPGGTLLFSLPPEVTDADFEIIKEQIREYFGQGRRVPIMRAGDIQIVYFEDGEFKDETDGRKGTDH